jgi:hypothetical protein
MSKKAAEPPIEESPMGFLDRLNSLDLENPGGPSKDEDKTPIKDEADEEDDDPKVTPEKKAELKDNPLEGLDSIPKKKGEAKTPLDKDEEPKEPGEDDEEDDDESEGKGGDIRHQRFRELKQETKVLSGTLQERESELAATRARVAELEAATSEYAEMKAEMDRYKSERAVLHLEQSEEFESQITKPLKELLTEAYSVTDAYSESGLSSEKVADVLGITDRRERNKALRELQDAHGIDPEDKDLLTEIGARIVPLLKKRDELFGNAEEALLELKQTESKRTAKDLLERAEARKETAKEITKTITAKIPFLASLEGVDLAEVQSHVSERDFDSLDVPNKVYNHMAGHLLPMLASKYAALMESWDEAQEELEGFRGADPKLGTGKTTAPTDRVTARGVAPGKGGEEPSFLDLMESGGMFGG